MESRVGSSHDAQFPKKSRSLDLKSLYKSKVSKGSSKEGKIRTLKRKGNSVLSSADEETKRKRSKKEASGSSLKNADRNSKKSLTELYNGGVGSGSNDLEDIKTGVSGQPNTGESESGASFSLDGNAIQIPKRKRGFVGRKKVKASQEVNLRGQSGSGRVSCSTDQANKSEDGLRDDTEHANEDDCSEGLKEKTDLLASSDQQHPKVEGDIAANKDELPVKKLRRRRKQKNAEVLHTKFVQVAEPAIDNSVKACNDPQEDDEENLEENAARMLSSRFDPSCTGFSSNSKISAQSSKRKAMAHPSRKSFKFGSRSLGETDASLDAADRMLRPRKQNKQNGHVRKRRHFYEIFTEELDALWVLNKKIKVFWPLDEKWYYGLVNDYDEERKLHHVKYDDRDEEWINLQSEKFKLLLLRGEVAGKAGEKRVVLTEKQLPEMNGSTKRRKKDRNKNLSMADDNAVVDSEPIISWLARSKHSTSHAVKKQKSSVQALHCVPYTSSDNSASLQGDSLKRGVEKLHSASLSLDTSVRSTENVSNQQRKLPIVYVRRNSRKTGEAFSHSTEDDSVYASILKHEIYLSSVADGTSGCDIAPGKSKSMRSLWSGVDSSLLDQIVATISKESGGRKFVLCTPVNFDLSYSFGTENLRLFRALLLLWHGVLMIMWPKVHLEMLFVDSIVGLRFILFEGSLKDALIFTVMVFSILTANDDSKKKVNLQLPVTSISFKLVSVQGCRKQLVFAFYNFFELEHSKWMYLDAKLKKQCLLTKQLPLSECTYDNIKGLHNGTSRSLESCQRESSQKKRHKQGLTHKNVQTDCDFTKARSSREVNIIHGKLPPFALSFAAAPTFFLGLHLEMLMRNAVTSINICEQMKHLQYYFSCELTELGHKGGSLLGDVVSDKCVSSVETDTGTSSVKGCVRTDVHVSGISTRSKCHDLVVDGSKSCKRQDKLETFQRSRLVVDIPLGHSLANGNTPDKKFEKSGHKDLLSATLSSDLALNVNGGIISPNPTAPRTMWGRSRSGLSSGYSSHGFVNGPKKPRTQVSYLLPFGSFDFNSKNRGSHQKMPPHKRIRRPTEKRSSDVSSGSQRNFDLLSCDANVLITNGDKGWRECGAKVALEPADQNEWKLAVKISGNTLFSYKAHQFLQPGSTNRYTLAMMWKGGKDWTLEFPDRSQWALFKEMHEECHNRNVRAASLKSIPIPGVRLIDANDGSGSESTFVRNTPKYIRQIETDIEMALNPSLVLYDMDSEDEKWISTIRNSSDAEDSNLWELSDEVFERMVDRFEKSAYVRQRDHFTSDEIEELMNDVGPVELLKTIHDYWRQKREKKRMPLIRHLQPPMWERYEQLVREWELSTNKANSGAIPNGCDKAAAAVATEKPPMFAFCMKPRGLEVPNKGSKHRSQKRMSVSAHGGAPLGDHDGFHSYGRRLNGFGYGDERGIYQGHSYDSMEDSPLPRNSPRLISSRDAETPGGYFSMNNDRYYSPKLHRNKPRRSGTLISSPHDTRTVVSSSPRPVGWRNGVYRGEYPDWRSQRHNFDGSVLDEYTLRDASGAAKHARNMARIKRERAKKMFFRADLAVHKAVAALMTADAMKASCSSSPSSSWLSLSASYSTEDTTGGE